MGERSHRTELRRPTSSHTRPEDKHDQDEGPGNGHSDSYVQFWRHWSLLALSGIHLSDLLEARYEPAHAVPILK